MGIIYSGICRFCVCVFVFLSVFKFVLFKSGNHTAGCDYLSANALPRAAEMGRWQPRRHWQMGWAQPRWHTPNFRTSSAPNMPPTDLQVLIWVWMTFTHTTWWEKEKPIYCEESNQDGTPTSLPLPPPNMPPTDQVLLRVLPKVWIISTRSALRNLTRVHEVQPSTCLKQAKECNAALWLLIVNQKSVCCYILRCFLRYAEN